MRIPPHPQGATFERARSHFQAMTGIFFLSSLLLGWALGCGVIYTLLRWLNISFGPAIRCAGAWALVTWVPVCIIVGGASDSWHYREEPYPLSLTLGILAATVSNFLAGSFLLRFLTHRSELWWHEVLLYALYLGCAFTWGEALLVCWPMPDGPLHDIAQWNGEVRDAHLLMLCVWLFPLGAPLIELIGRNLWRLHRELSP